MPDFANPYASPEVSAATAAEDGRISRGLDKFSLIAWPVVFVLNMIVPLLFSLRMIEEHGLRGMAAACGLLLIVGWWVCLAKPWFGRRLIAGGALVAVSQVVPVLQIGMALVALELASWLGLDINNNGFLARFNAELPAFFVTLLVGGGLIACAVLAGLVLGIVLPGRRRDRPVDNANE